MKKISLALFAVLVSSLSVFGQGARNIKINEVMTNNTASMEGTTHGWSYPISPTRLTMCAECMSLQTAVFSTNLFRYRSVLL